MEKSIRYLLLTAGFILFGALRLPAAAEVTVTIEARPLNAGQIDPRIFGNFIELLDDVGPGMWAELLNDRSFEGVTPAANWCYYDGSLDICDRKWDTNASWSRVTDQPFNGAQCAKLTAGSEPAILTQSGLSSRKGMDYHFSGYFRAEPGIKAGVRLKFRLPTGDWLTLASAELPPLSAQWRRVSVTMTSLGDTDRAVFELRAQGEGSLWADRLSLMPADNLKGWRRDVVDATKAVRPGVIRWGGSTVDPGAYRWKQGIGDRDLRVPFPNKNWGRMDPNDVGIEEFCQFCELTDAEPLICVSFSDGPQSAADLVQYCNGSTDTQWGAKRTANGHPAPFQVKLWQIGNEIGGDNPQYSKGFPDFITAMKQADPSIQILSSFPTKGLLDRVGKDIAFVCPHHYTADLAWCDREFNQISELIDHVPGCSDIKIGVTEWNTDAGSWGLGRGSFATLNVGLLNARYLHVMMRHCDKVKLACRSNLANSYCGAIIETSPTGDGVLKRPSYHVMDLYVHHFLPDPLALKQSSDLLDLFAGASPDRKSIVVFAINLKPESVALSVRFNGFANQFGITKAGAVCDTQNAHQPDVMNHWDCPDRVRIVTLPASGDTMTMPALSAAAIELRAK